MHLVLRTLVGVLTAAVAFVPVAVPTAAAAPIVAAESGVVATGPQERSISRDGLTLSWTVPDAAAHMWDQDRVYAGAVMHANYEGSGVQKVTYQWMSGRWEELSTQDTFTVPASEISSGWITALAKVEFEDGTTDSAHIALYLAAIEEPFVLLDWEQPPTPGGQAKVRATVNPRLAEAGWDGSAYVDLAIDRRWLLGPHDGSWTSRTFAVPGNASGKTYTLRASEIGYASNGAVPGYSFTMATLTGTIDGANRYGTPTLSAPNNAILDFGQWPGSVTAWLVNWYLDGTLVQSSRIQNKDFTDYLAQTPENAGHRVQAKVSVIYNDETVSPEISTGTVTIPLINDSWIRAAITGQPKFGTTLKAELEADLRLTKRTIQWTRDGKTIPGAVKTSYKLTTADVGHKVGVRFSAAATGYQTKTATASTGKVALAKLSSGGVLVKGTPRPGKTFKAVTTTWPSGVKYTYRWYRSGKPIKGATKVTYRLTKSDSGKRVHVVVTGTKPGHTTAKARSMYWTIRAR